MFDVLKPSTRYESPRIQLNPSKLEANFKAKKLISEENLLNLIKSLEIQLQRLDIYVKFDTNCEDPCSRLLQVVKSCVDQLVEVKEKLNLNSFISTPSEAEKRTSNELKHTADKLQLANKQLKHYERLLQKKEKMIIEREKNLAKELANIEKSKEQLEVTKSRLENIEKHGVHLENYILNHQNSDNLKNLALRITSEQENLEKQKEALCKQAMILEETMEKLEKEKHEQLEILEENKKYFEYIENQNQDIQETRKFIESQKSEILEIKSNNEKLLETVAKDRNSLKAEEEKLMRQKMELDSKIVMFNHEKNENSKQLSDIEVEKIKLSQEKDLVQQIKQKLNDEREMLKQEYMSLEDIKEHMATQSQLELSSRESLLTQKEEELEKTIVELKIQIESYNQQIFEKENEFKSKEEIIQEKERNLKICLANMKLVEMSLIESKNQCLEIQNNLIPEIESYIEMFQNIISDCNKLKTELEETLQNINIYGKMPDIDSDVMLESTLKENEHKDKNQYHETNEHIIHELTSELQEKISICEAREEELNLRKTENMRTADLLKKAWNEQEEKRKDFEVEVQQEREKLKKNFFQLENSLKMVKEKEQEVLSLRTELVEKEKLLRVWEEDIKKRAKAV